MKLILASSSPRRQELIKMLNIPFEVVSNDVDESVSDVLSPREVVEELSLRKAREAFKRFSDSEAIFIGSDTIVAINGEILGKPEDDQDAYRMLKLIQGQTHQVYTGITCISAIKTITKSRLTEVKIKPLSDSKILNYINTGEPKDKAGSYAAQGIGATLIESIDGDYFNVVGLPISLLSDILEEEFNISVI
ncbi:Maf family protein [Paenibacillus hamazuiensis]|uniref:Maf family protein n=1 Tax=Paenibacillus hamazuiensis TaxID=2936508 RepID=UPI00200D0034|nr:Maf family protein [Paenibacillus hamazuiensis]